LSLKYGELQVTNTFTSWRVPRPLASTHCELISPTLTVRPALQNIPTSPLRRPKTTTDWTSVLILETPVC